MRTKTVNFVKVKKVLLLAGFITGLISFTQAINKNDSTELKVADSFQKNTFYMEGLGSTIAYGTLNYDRIIKQEQKYKTSARIGLLFIPVKQFSFFVIAPEYLYLRGSRNHYLEFGGGGSYVSQTSKNVNVSDGVITFKGTSTISMLAITGRVGYRFQKPQGGLFFKIGFTPFVPLIIYESGIKELGCDAGEVTEYFPVNNFFPFPVLPSAGIGIGYTLRK